MENKLTAIFAIDSENVKTVEQIVEILKLMDIKWTYWNNMKIPEDILDLEKRKIIKRV